jgi:phage terminase small subunit
LYRKAGEKYMMTEKKKRFCDEYLIDTNATQAAIRAGYSVKTAYSQGQRLLKDAEVQNYIKEKAESIKDENIADATEVMMYLTSVLRSESRSCEIVVEGCGNGFSAARTVDKPPSEKDKLKAAELLGKRYGIWTEKISLDGVIPVVISGEDKLEE